MEKALQSCNIQLWAPAAHLSCCAYVSQQNEYQLSGRVISKMSKWQWWAWKRLQTTDELTAKVA